MSENFPIREYEEAVYVYWYGPQLPTVKIGHSNDPDKRLSQLGNDTGVPDHLASFAAIVWLDRKREKVEARVHELAARFRRSGEWFDISATAALGYIISAAQELNIRYEVEDRAGVYLAKTSEELREEELGIEKWGQNWRGMDAAEEAAEDKLDEAKTALEAAQDAVASSVDGVEQHMAKLALVDAESSLKRAITDLETIQKYATPAYRTRILKWRKISSENEAKAAYWKSHPEEWVKQQLIDAEVAERARLQKIAYEVAKTKRDADFIASSTAYWKNQWDKGDSTA